VTQAAAKIEAAHLQRRNEDHVEHTGRKIYLKTIDAIRIAKMQNITVPTIALIISCDNCLFSDFLLLPLEFVKEAILLFLPTSL